MNNHHLQATMAQLRRGQKQLCQREEDEGGEEKVGSVKKTERLKVPGMTKGESEVEGRTMSRGGREQWRMEAKGKAESRGLGPGILEVETADGKWQVQVRRGVVLYAAEDHAPPLPHTHPALTKRKWPTMI